MGPGYAIDRDGPARGVSRGPHARPGGVPRGDARLAARPARGIAHEILVVDDGDGDATADVVRRGRPCATSAHGARRGLNAARNTGLREAGAPLIAFVDDDVLAPPGWLDALVEGAERHPEAEAFGGPIRRASRGGRRAAAGARSRRSPRSTWASATARPSASGARTSPCAAARSSASGRSTRASCSRTATRRSGSSGCAPPAGAIVYLAARRARPPPHGRATPGCAAGPRRLRARARRPGERPPPRPRALARRRAARAGRLRLAHAAARLPAGRDHGRALGRPGRGGAAAAEPAMSGDFLSGDAGDVTHPWRRAKRAAGEVAFDRDRPRGARRPRADAIARAHAAAAGAGGGRLPAGLAAAADALGAPALRAPRGALRARRDGAADAALAAHTVAERARRRQVREPQPRAGGARTAPSSTGCSSSTTTCACRARFLDRFVGLCERFGLDLAQPAQSQRSHSAWRVTRRRPASLVRETRFVEIGPLTAFGRRPRPSCCRSPSCASAGASTCTGPRSPPSAAGGSAWSTPRRCATRRPRSARPTGRDDAEAEAAGFLADRPYLPAAQRARCSRPTGAGPLMRLLFVARTCTAAAPSATGRR